MRHLFLYTYLFVSKISHSYCTLRNMGEVTNFTEFIEDNLYDLANVKGFIEPSLPAAGLGIVGGFAAVTGEFPHSVIFMNYEGLCAGIIISNKLVLTAAHCLDHNKNILEMRIFSGSRYLFDPAAAVHSVWDFIIHNKYNSPINFAYDAALLIIRDTFLFNKPTVQKALIINNKDWMKEDTKIKVSGWGETIPGTGLTSTKGLMTTELKFLPHFKCKTMAGTNLTSDMFCLWGDGVSATCRGDSGAGAMWNNMVVGIVSHGGACLKRPGVYTNVYFLRPWIDNAATKLYHKYCKFYSGREYVDYL